MEAARRLSSAEVMSLLCHDLILLPVLVPIVNDQSTSALCFIIPRCAGFASFEDQTDCPALVLRLVGCRLVPETSDSCFVMSGVAKTLIVNVKVPRLIVSLP